MLDRLYVACLRPALELLGLTGLLTLGACGGGSGAPNNPYAPVGESGADRAAARRDGLCGIPGTLSITSVDKGHSQRFRPMQRSCPCRRSSPGYSVVLLANKVTHRRAGQDHRAGMPSVQTVGVAVTVKSAPILNTLVVTASGTDCGNSVCSGQTGSAAVTASGPAGGGVPGAADPL